MDPFELTTPEFWESTEPVVLAPPHLESQGVLVEEFLKSQDWSSGTVVFATSGSTGSPKWVVHTRTSLLASAEMVNRHLAVNESDCWLLALPHYHVGGFGVLARAYQAGCHVAIFQEKWDARKFTEKLGSAEATLTSLVPTQVHDLVGATIDAPKNLRAVLVGGGSLTRSQSDAARDLGWPVLQSYGMTEAGSQIATEKIGHSRGEERSFKLPILEGWETRVGADEVLEIRGEPLFVGYIRKESTGFRCNLFPRDHWFVTNDIVDLTESEIVFRRRLDREVKVRGELVDLGELEDRLLAKVGSLGGCVVVAMEDARVGYRLYPVLEFGQFSDDEIENVIAELNGSLPKFCQLEKPFKLAKLPRTELGKIDICRLKQLLDN